MKSNVMQRSKLSWKMAIIYATIFSLILLLLNFAVLYGVRLFLVSQATQKIDNLSNTIASNIIGSPSEKTSLDDPELVSDAVSDSTIGIRIASPEGKDINKSNNFPDNGLSITEYIGIDTQLTLGNERFMVKNSKIMNSGNIIAYLQIVINMRREYDFIRVLMFLMIAANIIGIALSFFAGYLTSKRLLSPIDRITNAVQAIDINDLNTHVDEGKADDELSRLTKTFNKMIDRLRQSFEKQNRFVSDASHELRTPIAIIRGYAGLINKWGRENNDIFEESVHAIIIETSEMTELIEKLLLIAKSDNNGLKVNPTAFCLSRMLEEVVNESKVISLNHAISCAFGEPITISADRLMIKQALRAVIENSIKFTPLQGSIAVGYVIMEESVAITVKDTGIGIPVDEVDNIFERFYRVDKSRSKETGGSGLGLSIVQLIVKAHNGTVFASSKPGEGTTISITLPVDKDLTKIP
jgi:two-component system, OmpR family, sensor histidine kinase ArlS